MKFLIVIFRIKEYGPNKYLLDALIKNKFLMKTFLSLLKGLFLFFCIPYFVWKQKTTV
jgi:hypothetical protein